MKKIIIALAALAALACGVEPAAKPSAATPPDGQKPAAPAPAAGTTEPAPAPPAAVPDTDEHADPELGADPASRVSADVPPEAAAVPGEIPTAEDFEEKAASDLSKGNLETEVSRMEKEIGVKNQ
jgi:hypothetical protein